MNNEQKRLIQLHRGQGYICSFIGDLPMYSKSGKVIGKYSKLECSKAGYENNKAVYYFK